MESSPKIAVVGFSARAAAQCAKRQGFEVIAVDACSDRDLGIECQAHFQLNDPNTPVALNASYPTVPILLAGGMENRTIWVEKCQTNSLRLGANVSRIRAMRCLDNWAAWAIASDLRWPVTLRTLSEIQGLKDELYPGSEWLLKPLAGSGGNGITDWNKKEGQDPTSRFPLATSYVQQRLPGDPIGVTFLSSHFGSVVVGVTASWQPEASHSGGPTYAYRGSYGPIPLSSEQLAKLQSFATLVGVESGLLGLWQADFLRHGSELTLLEINPRWSASMDLLDVSLSIPLVQLHYACVCGLVTEQRISEVSSQCLGQAKSPKDRMLGKLIVYAPNPFVVTPKVSDKWWSQRWTCDPNSTVQRHFFADIPNPSTSISTGEPVLTVMASERMPEALMAELQRGKMEVLDGLEGLRSL